MYFAREFIPRAPNLPVFLRNTSAIAGLIDGSIVDYGRGVRIERGQYAIPKVRIRSVTSSSAGVYFDVSDTVGDCGSLWLNLSVQASCLSSSAAVNKTLVTTALTSNLRNSLARSHFRVDRGIFPSLTSTWSVNVSACNILGICGFFVSTFAVNGTSSTVHPIARIFLPNSVSGGSSTLSILQTKIGDKLELFGDAFVPVDGSVTGLWRRYSNLNYTWILVNNNRTKEQIRLTESSDPLVFRLPAYSLAPNTSYTLMFSATDMMTGALGTSDPVLITSIASPFEVVLIPSQTLLTLSLGQSTVLDASQSYDPDSGYSDLSKNLSFAWVCSGEVVTTLGTRMTGLSCPVAIAIPSGSDGRTLQVTVVQVPSNATEVMAYITVKVWNGQILSKAHSQRTLTIKVASVSTASIFVYTPMAARSNILDTQALEVAARITLSKTSSTAISSSSVSLAEWSLLPFLTSQSLIGYLSGPLTSASATLFAGSNVSLPLKLRAGALLPAARYTFRLSVDSSVFADIVVTTNQSPFGGALYVLPKEGIALLTPFVLTAAGWHDDSSNEIPLRFAFSVWVQNKWVALQSASVKTTADEIYLPCGSQNSSYHVQLRLVVQDSLGAATNASNVALVRPPLVPVTASPFSFLRAIVRNASIEPAQRLQETMTVVTACLQSSCLPMSAVNQRTLYSDMINAVQSSLSTTDSSFVDDAKTLILWVSTGYKSASIAIAQEAAKAPTSGTTNSNASTNAQAQVSQSQALVGLLAQSLLDLKEIQQSGGSTQVIQLALDNVRYALALNLASQQNTTQNSSSVVYFPTISIPNSQNTLSVVNNAGAGSGALISVVEYDLSALFGSNSTASDTANSLVQSILSNIISIKVVYTTNTSQAVLPTFSANFSLISGSNTSSSIITGMLEHNCTVGEKETVSFYCADSNVRMNLTCSGLAAAVVRRKCPVPRRVCNVLNLQQGEVNSEEYCVAVQSSASSVTCKCGYGSAGNSSSSSAGIIGPTGDVSVAVMTEYVASDFVNTVSITGKISGGSVSGGSLAVFLVFGSFWGLGILVICMRLFSDDEHHWLTGKKKIKHRSKKVFDDHQNHLFDALSSPGAGKSSHEIAPASMDVHLMTMRKILRDYLTTTLPSALRPHTWSLRLWHELCRRHPYMQVLHEIFSSEHHHKGSKAQRREHNRHTALELAELLTALTISCFVIAVLYDLQYPNNDGSCEFHKKEAECLQRRSPLDSSQRYCEWFPAPEAISAGSIVDIRSGVILQTVPLETEVSDDIINEAQCRYHVSVASPIATAEVAVLTSLIAIVVWRILTALFEILAARTVKEANNDAVARQALAVQKAHLQAITPLPNSTGDRRRRHAAIQPMSTATPLSHAGQAASGPGAITTRRRRAILPAASAINSAVPPDAMVTSTASTSVSASVSAPQVPSSLIRSIDKDDSAMTVSVSEETRLSESLGTGDNTPPTTSSSTNRTYSLPLAIGMSWRRLVAYIKLQWEITTHDMLAVKIPADVEITRKRFFAIVFATEEQQPSNNGLLTAVLTTSESSDITARTMPIRESNHPAECTPSNSVKAASQALVSAAQKAQRQLAHASELEYGVALLHRFLIDLLGSDTPVARLFKAVVKKDFARSISAASERTKWLAGGAIVLSNLAALYFVLSKGIQRGGAWQRSFLYACVLQWVMDEVLLQLLDVLWIDFALPGLIYREVQVRGVLPLFQLADELVFNAKHIARESIARVAAEELTKEDKISYVLAHDRSHMLESQLVLLHQLGQELDRRGVMLKLQLMRRQEANSLKELRGQKRLNHREMFLQRISSMSIETQRIIFRFISSVLFGVFILAWFLALNQPRGKVYVSMMVLALLIIVVVSLVVSWRDQQVAVPSSSGRPLVQTAISRPEQTSGTSHKKKTTSEGDAVNRMPLQLHTTLPAAASAAAALSLASSQGSSSLSSSSESFSLREGGRSSAPSAGSAPAPVVAPRRRSSLLDNRRLPREFAERKENADQAFGRMKYTGAVGENHDAEEEKSLSLDWLVNDDDSTLSLSSEEEKEETFEREEAERRVDGVLDEDEESSDYSSQTGSYSSSESGDDDESVDPQQQMRRRLTRRLRAQSLRVTSSRRRSSVKSSDSYHSSPNRRKSSRLSRRQSQHVSVVNSVDPSDPPPPLVSLLSSPKLQRELEVPPQQRPSSPLNYGLQFQHSHQLVESTDELLIEIQREHLHADKPHLEDELVNRIDGRSEGRGDNDNDADSVLDSSDLSDLEWSLEDDDDHDDIINLHLQPRNSLRHHIDSNDHTDSRINILIESRVNIESVRKEDYEGGYEDEDSVDNLSQSQSLSSKPSSASPDDARARLWTTPPQNLYQQQVQEQVQDDDWTMSASSSDEHSFMHSLDVV